MTFNRQNRHFDPSKTATNLSNSMILSPRNEKLLPKTNCQ